ncbi:MAG: helix-turn-helix domain-containing protein [Gordonia sp. (in: high G+C Gram-positive bacteria)]|uniref:helix-turn-helix domain-containing protein n=1 Tax=Gordonia sp. (in: high G+C Gram-positive bacteria) TaxID=84139 RepID=UPI003C737742
MPAPDAHIPQRELDARPVRREAVGAALRAARIAAGLNKQQAVELSGVSRHSLMRLEAGSGSMNLDRLWSLARAYGTTPSAILAAAERDPEAAETLKP